MPRVADGFRSLEGGMNGAVDPMLIGANQCAMARDFTFRDGFASTRPPWANRVLTFNNAITKANFTGIFQGSTFYLNEFGSPGFVVAMGGRLFAVILNNNTTNVSEITPTTLVITLGVFTVPAVAAQVTIGVNEQAALSVGQSIIIDGGSYTINNVLERSIVATYASGAAHATVAAGASILDMGSNPITFYFLIPTTFDYVDLFQAENYVIALAGQQAPRIYDGSVCKLAGPSQIPPGVFGIYCNGRIWVVLPDRRSFVAGDLVGSSSGTPALQYKDAILYMTENTFLNGGGAFSVPGSYGLITGLAELETLDTSLGLGQLLVGTTLRVCSVNAPVDRTTWQNLTYPILTSSVIDYGPTSNRSFEQVNGDLWYRSPDGFRSFTAARIDFQRWNNTPQSREIAPFLGYDNPGLLEYASSIIFNNRLFNTVSPQRTAYGVVHQGLGVISFDNVSQLRNKAEPAWEGAWSGLQIFQVVKGLFGSHERAFAFALGDNNALELWELGASGYYDQYTYVSGNDKFLTRTAIQPVLETRAMACGDDEVLKKLTTAALYLDQIVDTVTLVIKYRPDQYPGWTTWDTITICANVSQCSLSQSDIVSCAVWKSAARSYAARIMIKSPAEVSNALSGKPMHYGHLFQFRIEGTGKFRIRKFMPYANVCSDQSEGGQYPSSKCTNTPYCAEAVFGVYDSHG